MPAGNSAKGAKKSNGDEKEKQLHRSGGSGGLRVVFSRLIVAFHGRRA